MDVAVLTAQFKAEIAGFMRDAQAVDAMLATVRSETRGAERDVVALSAALDTVKANRAAMAEIATGFGRDAAAAKDLRNQAVGAAAAVDSVKASPTLTAANIAQFEAQTAKLKALAVAGLEARAAMPDGVAGGPTAFQTAAGSVRFVQAPELSNGISTLTVQAVQQHGLVGGFLGAATANQVDAAVKRAAQQSGGGGGGGFFGGLLAGAGFGGGRGIFIPGLGFGFGRRAFGGAAALGSIGGLVGFGAERALATTAGIAGSLGGGLLGGGLLAAGVLGTTAVGMGTDLAGIGQAAGDIKTVSTDLGALQTAIRVYGRNSTQAAQAQAQLNQDLGAFSPVARNAVLAAAQTSQGFKKMFDQVTGLAERTGAEIINQAMRVGEKFLPTIGKFSFQNMQIIQHGIQPFFSWLQQKGPQGGLGIFTNLEQIFQARLPTMVHALTQGAELFAKVIDVAAQHTGGLAQHINAFFTKWNSASNFGAVSSEVGKLISLFRTWMGLFGSLIKLVFDLFKPAVGLGKQFAQSLTDIVNQVRAWVLATGTQNVLHSLFAAHAQQVKLLGQLLQALLPLLLSVVSAFLQIEAAFASAFNNGLRPIIDAVKWLFSHSIVTWFLGWAGAAWLVARAATAIGVGFRILASGKILEGLRGVALGFLGIQTAAVKAQIATDAETTSLATMEAVGAGGGAAVAAGEGGLLARLGLSVPYGLGGIAKGALGRLGPAALLAGGGFLLGGLAQNVVGGQAGRQAGGALQGAGVGAGLGFLVGNAPGAAIGAGLGAMVGYVISLNHNVPTLTQNISKLGAAFLALGRNTKDTGGLQAKFANQLNQIADQAKAAEGRVSSFAGIPYWHSNVVPTQAQALQNYVQNLTKLADSVRSSDPKLAAVYQDLINIAEGVHKIQSRKTVQILLHEVVTRTYAGTRLGPGGDIFPAGPRNVSGGSGGSQYPPLNLNLPAGISFEIKKAQAGHGSITKADAAAYTYYENLLKRHNLTRKQILAIYTAEAQYAPYQTPGSVPHATGSLTGAATGAGLLPAAMQNALSRAQQRASAASVTSVGSMTPAQLQRALAANRQLHAEQAVAIQDLIAKASQVNASSKQHLALEKEITALTRQQAATQRQITDDLKQQHALVAQSRINRILGLGGGSAGLSQTASIQQRERDIFIKALEQVLGGSKHNLAVTAQALGVTPGQLSRESPAELLRQMRQHGITLDAKSLAELRKIQEVLKIAHAENVKLTPAETRKITNWLQQIQQELAGTSTTASNYIAPSARALVAGLGLTAAQRAAEIGRLSSYYMHGKRVPTGGAAGGIPLPPGVGGGVDLPPPPPPRHHGRSRGPQMDAMVVHGDIVIYVSAAGKDGAVLAREIRSELLKIQRRNGAQTRGNNAGKGVGLA